MKKLLLFVLFISIGLNLNATHLLGGEIKWECVNTNQYQFTVKVYRDCGQGNAILPLSLSLSSTSSAGTIPCTRILLKEVSPDCYLSGGSPSCGVSSSGEGSIEMGVYQSQPISLMGVPPVNGWMFSWYGCCRPGTITNSPTGGFVLRAIMYPYTDPITGLPLNTNSCYDNSPSFLEDPKVVVCSGSDVNYNNLGYDTDLDSLYYEWATGWSAINTPIIYNTGYSYINPLPSTIQNTNNIAVSLDGESGHIKFKSFTSGSFVTVLKVEEWRCNQLIGEIYRDIPIIIRSCVQDPGICNTGANNPPSFSISVDTILYPNMSPLIPVLNSNNDTVYYETTVYAGEQVDFRLASYDLDLRPNCVPQDITFSGAGGQLSTSTNWNNPSICLLTPPCATLTSANFNGGFVSKLNNFVDFNWQTTCDHVTYQQYNCGSFKSSYDFYFRAEDDACPTPAFSYISVKVHVLNYKPTPPDPLCASIDIIGNITINWTTPLDTGFNFDNYYIYHSTNLNGAYTILDSIFNYNTTSFIHVGQTISPHFYYMTTKGGCELVSDNSDTISLINEDIINIDSVSVVNGLSTLSWRYSSLIESYLIYIYTPNGYVLIDTVDNPDTIYTYLGSDANNKSEQFVIVSSDSCGNQGILSNSVPHNTIYLSTKVNSCDGYVNIYWNNYNTWDTTTYDLMVDITDNIGNVTTNILSSNISDTTFRDNSVVSGNNYCYYIRVKDTMGNSSTSNIVCVDPSVILKSRLSYLARATVRTNGSVNIYGFIDKDADVKEFKIGRSSHSELGPFLYISSIPIPTIPPYIINFNDYSSDADNNRYFYRMISIDYCDNIDTISNVATNIFLQTEVGSLSNTLSWTPYQEFGGKVDRYDVYRQIDNRNQWILLGNVKGKDTVYKDNISKLENTEGIFCYYVVAHEKDNALRFIDEYGNNFNSKSNISCIQHDPRMFFPSAFSPYSNVNENTEWKPQHSFIDKDNYTLRIYNRWGEEVFFTQNIDESWNGFGKDGSMSPLGTYTFYVSYKSKNGILIEERGIFTLIN